MRELFAARSDSASRRLGFGLWALAGVVALLQVLGALQRPIIDRLADLHVYWGSVRFLLHGRSLYDFVAHNDAPFTYPPFAGLVFAPLGLVPESALRLLWTAATVAVVVVLARLSLRADGARPAPAGLALPAITLFLFASAPISSNIRFGQISLFLIVLVVIDSCGVLPRRYQGILTGLAAAIKLTPALFAVYWFFSGQRRRALTTLASFLICTALAWAVLPGESVRFWFTEIWNVDRVGNIATNGNQSLNGALLRWDAPDTVRVVVAAIVGITVIIVAIVRATRAERNAEPFAAVVIVAAAGLVFSPVSWTHHQTWLVLAALLVVSERRAVNLWWAAVVGVLMLAPVPGVLAELPGGAVTGNARLVLALAVACVIPFRAVRRPRHEGRIPHSRQPRSAADGRPASGGDQQVKSDRTAHPEYLNSRDVSLAPHERGAPGRITRP